jgi:alpha-1,3-rhamnosyl/mannosyltransferase
VRFLGYVTPADLPALYSAARLLMIPSLAEGFGLPALEAMACGTPVAASQTGALPETLGGAGLLFDPLAPSAIAEAMRCLLEDDDFNDELRRKGLRRAGQFSWRASARQLAQVLEEVAV